MMWPDLKQRITCFMEQLRSFNFSQSLEGLWANVISPNLSYIILVGVLATILGFESVEMSRQDEALARLDLYIGDGVRVTSAKIAESDASNKAAIEAHILESEARMRAWIRQTIQEECN